MKRLCFSIGCLLLSTDPAVAGEGVPAEVPTMVELSALQVERKINTD